MVVVEMRRILLGRGNTLFSSNSFALAALSVAAGARSYIFFTDGEGRTSTVLTELLSPEGVGLIWAIVATVTVLSLFMKKLQTRVMAIQVGAHVLMSLALFFSWMGTGFGEQHAAGISYGLVALLLFWGVARTTLRPEEVPIPREEQEVGDD